MAFSDDQQPYFKHFCRICKKGFMCGRALGGHMRAHGVSDETGNLDDQDPTTDSNWDGNKKMYALRTNPNRFSRVCENCGKEFLSWKSFLEHGKCSSDDAESSLVWSPESEADDDDDGAGVAGCHHGGGGSGWSKRKRSFRVCSSEDEEDVALAKCLMALSNTTVDPVELEVADEHLFAAIKREEQRRNPIFSSEFLPTFTKPPPPFDKAKTVVAAAAASSSAAATTPKGMFECKACKKVFNSHQALGGHRASHKNVKGCFAARNDQFDDNLAYEDVAIVQNDLKSVITRQSLETGPNTGPISLAGRKSKVHKCSICSRIFASGQALGGHKRCHWLTSSYTSEASLNKFNFHEHIDQLHRRALAIPKELELNLNLNLPVSGNTPTADTRPDLQNPARLDQVSTDINLHAWSSAADQENGDHGDAKADHKHQLNNNNSDQDDQNAAPPATAEMVEDEGESKVKLAKLSELKEMNDNDGSSSSWLQVGIGSTTDVGPTP
ncbi:uncharacterized protein LOC112529081 [Cynara cardunculus var. scolymus]|uniref:Zinc finger, C2H2 n=1 Tax=Cynara cardunculus var. scolymus TaxID=59895 RepID=A0A103XIJ8_CYNCS|nr:uncharacterized protein LOC112529081 [Cynara cardunculus var. scolymus]KVH91214.1 Zinc finger, C2H2 [Cynara cardunculus var. scolymus]